ncbi:hypothetical protein [Bradyrhizobium liaoningense]|uniref:Cap15 family cyclic dinucleotide receptor domain-containing protein n=1 Tax=Bradyrhizobium liaoningense TaxID=43992 RepID=UPI001BA914D4|nr:hypothetical protein [Bradyrhizobium liaoningense]MBR0713964.1 hypothetical protein [Bradyrhizobium liaoningense]
MREHEYALLGAMNRAHVGRYLGLVSAAASALIVYILLSAVDIAHRFGWNVTLTPSILSLVGAATVFTALYWLFDRFAWKWRFLKLVIKVPDIAGQWDCQGQTINPDGSQGHSWRATITILQSWDRIRVLLKTNQSGSNSISAALICDDADAYRLLYHYRNVPRIDEVDLQSHLGFGELVFGRDLGSAEGEYFNGHGRNTFGTMKLTRI